MLVFIKRIIKYIYYHFISKNKVQIHFVSNVDFDSIFGKNCVLQKHSRVSSSSLGNNILLFQHAKIKNSELSNHVNIYDESVVVNSKIEDYTYLSKNVTINKVNIGKYCSIGQDVLIGLGMHPTNFLSTSPFFYSASTHHGFKTFSTKQTFEEYKTTTIGNDVWIGARAIILDGIVIGNGAIVAAGSVVTKNVEPYSIVGGVPAKLIKLRFEKETIEKIQNTAWWNWSETEIQKNKHVFNKELRNDSEFSTFLS